MERSEELSMDQAFLKKLTESVFINLNNEQFGAEELAKCVGLSRSQVHRRLHKINGHSITQFIREIRLKEAHRLLEKGVGTAAEVAYRVGFSSPTYFNTCFHDFYGYTPGETSQGSIELSSRIRSEQNVDLDNFPKSDITLKERKHAAILFSDIVGYTALMGNDEDQAFDLLRENREIHTRIVGQFHGSLIKEMGDGMLISFELSSEAVICAMEIQKECRKHEIPLRIGIHEGEMIFDGNDVFGDGVNIASRIQSITDPGGIYVSETLQKSIRSKRDIHTKDLGVKSLKNVNYQVRIFAIQTNGLPIPTQTRIKGLRKIIFKNQVVNSAISFIFLTILLSSIGWIIHSSIFQKRPTLLIFIPENHTGIDTIPHLISGIHTALIGEVGKIGELNMISPYTSRAYRDLGQSLKSIARETKANYIVQPSLFCIGDTVCLNIIMTKIDSKENQIWSENFIRERKEIFAMYHEITKEIAEKISLVVAPEENLLSESKEVVPEAYDAFLKGQYLFEHLHPDSIQKAKYYFEVAIERDPDWAAPYAMLGTSWFGQAYLGFLPWANATTKAHQYLSKALELNPNSAITHYSAGLAAAWIDWDWEKAEMELLKSIELNPNYVLSRIYYAHVLMIQRRSDEAIEQANIALELDPLSPIILDLNGRVMQNAGDYETAIARFEKAYAINPNYGLVVGHLRDVYQDAGEYEKWIDLWKERSCWDDSIKMEIEGVLFEKGYVAAKRAILDFDRLHGNNDCQLSDAKRMSHYLDIGDYEQVIDHLEKLYKRSWGSIPYIATNYYGYNEMKDHPRFQELLKKMNLPIE